MRRFSYASVLYMGGSVAAVYNNIIVVGVHLL